MSAVKVSTVNLRDRPARSRAAYLLSDEREPDTTLHEHQ